MLKTCITDSHKLGDGFLPPPTGLTADLPVGSVDAEAEGLRSEVPARPATRAEPERHVNQVGVPALAGAADVRPPEGGTPTLPPEPKYRWEDSFRQEALDYHCLKFGLPPATTDMATGIPDPFKMSPRMWMERGFPYQIYIDRDIPCDRKNPLDTMGVIKLACHRW